MSTKIIEKINSLPDNFDFPDDIDELNEMRDYLYKKMSSLDATIINKSENLTEFYQNNIKQNRAAYIKDDKKAYSSAKKVDNLVNEYNNTCILIELIEKQIEKVCKK